MHWEEEVGKNNLNCHLLNWNNIVNEKLKRNLRWLIVLKMINWKEIIISNPQNFEKLKNHKKKLEINLCLKFVCVTYVSVEKV